MFIINWNITDYDIKIYELLGSAQIMEAYGPYLANIRKKINS